MAIEPFLERWLKEIRRTLMAFENPYPQHVVQKVILSGGSAGWKGLAERLSEYFERPVELDH